MITEKTNIQMSIVQDNDYIQILEIWKEGLLSIYPDFTITDEQENLFKENFENRKFPYTFWVAKDNDVLLGWCSILPVFSHPLKRYSDAEVSTYIEKKIKHNGIGSDLMQFVFNQIETTNIKNVWGFANPKNLISIKMCENCGMRVCGESSTKIILIKEQ
jgi:L-amino acid N-acyltransferase YncA